ncbi:MAG: hypothetical protein ACJ79H_20875 [Myxococcales bacterium]
MSRSAVLALSFLLAAAAAARAAEASPPAATPGAEPSAGGPEAFPSVSAHQAPGGPAVHGSVAIAASTGSPWADLFLNLLTFGVYAATVNEHIEGHRDAVEDSWGRALERAPDGAPAPPLQQRRYGPVHRDAREGFLFSFGVGGGAVRFSDPSFLRGSALSFGLRMGYGFSDRFQLFGDFSADAAFYSQGRELTNWLVTLRGQTVLIGDTLGNGLNLNLGFGLGGITINNNFGPDISSAAAPAVVAGLSYDARVGRHFAVSPEIYFSYHQVPNGPGFADDQLWSTGLRLNFLWYSPVY